MLWFFLSQDGVIEHSNTGKIALGFGKISGLNRSELSACDFEHSNTEGML
jgi:hypothetical protein